MARRDIELVARQCVVMAGESRPMARALRPTAKVYYDNELAAHDAARAQSRDCAFGLYVDEDHNGFYVTALGRVGSFGYYMCGYHESELEDNEVAP